MKKILTIVGVIALLLVLLIASVGVWAYYEFLYTHPLDEQELAELKIDWDNATGGNWSPWWDRGDGTIEWNPSASYNEWMMSIPDEQKAWPILVQVYYDHHKGLYQEEAYLQYTGTLPHHAERWAIWRGLIETDAFMEITDRVQGATTREYLGAELRGGTERFEHSLMMEYGYENADDASRIVSDPSMIDAHLGWLGRMRSSSTNLCARAAYELEEGNPDEFVRFIESAHTLAGYAREFPILISELVYIAIESMISNTLSWGLVAHPDAFEATHLQRLDTILAEQGSFEFEWGIEQMGFHDSVRRMCDTEGEFSPRQIATYEFSGPASSLPIEELGPTAQRMLYVYRKSLAQGDALGAIPWDEDIEEMESVLERERGALNKITNAMLEVLIPALDRVPARVRNFRQETIALRLALASYMHRDRHGAFPETIDAIDEDLMTFNPIDAFTGEPLKYTIRDGLPLIYSVGDNQTDDGGMIRWAYSDPDSDGNRQRSQTWPEWWRTEDIAWHLTTIPDTNHGDWVLFPMPVSDPDPIEDDYDPDWDLKQDWMYNEESGAMTIPEEG